jgi:hypothetical protein
MASCVMDVNESNLLEMKASKFIVQVAINFTAVKLQGLVMVLTVRNPIVLA